MLQNISKLLWNRELGSKRRNCFTFDNGHWPWPNQQSHTLTKWTNYPTITHNTVIILNIQPIKSCSGSVTKYPHLFLRLAWYKWPSGHTKNLQRKCIHFPPSASWARRFWEAPASSWELPSTEFPALLEVRWLCYLFSILFS